MLVVGFLLCLAAGFSVRADVTMQYSYEIKTNPAIPPQAAEAMQAQLKQITQGGMRMQLKGNRAYSNVMGIAFISDFDGEMITLVDAKQSRYSTVQKDEYLKSVTKRQDSQMAQIPAEARKRMDQLAVDVKTELTGKSLTIHGIEAEERLITISMGMPNTPGMMRTVISNWAPKDADMTRNPMLQELRVFTQRAYMGTDPGAAARKMFDQTPGLGSAAKMMDAFKDTPVILKMQMSIYPPPGVFPGANDGPILELIMDLKELSAAEVPVSVFSIPREYTVVPIEEALKGIYAQFTPSRPPAAKPAPAKPDRQ